MTKVWQQSNPTAEPSYNRIERGMAVFLVNGKLTYKILPTQLGDNACENSSLSGSLQTLADSTLVAVFHTHPGKVGDKIRCTSSKSRRYANQFGGPSHKDWANCTIWNPRIPCYVLDAANIYRMTNFPNMTNFPPAIDPYWTAGVNSDGNPDYMPRPSQVKKSQYYKKYSRKQGSCVRV